MALGAITWFCVPQQTTLKRAFMWSAVYPIAMMQSLRHIVQLTKASLSCWDIFMRCTMSAFNPCKVTGDYCLIGWKQLENPGVLLANPITHSKGGKPRDGGCSFGRVFLSFILWSLFLWRPCHHCENLTWQSQSLVPNDHCGERWFIPNQNDSEWS